MDDYVNELVALLSRISFKKADAVSMEYEEGIKHLVNGFSEKKSKGSKIFFIGNGGSAAIASHMTADYMKNGGMNTYSLYDTIVTACIESG